MKTIHKVTISTDSHQFSVPVDAKMLTVKSQNDNIVIYYETEHSEKPDLADTKIILVMCVGTGHCFNPEGVKYFGTCLLYSESLVMHVYVSENDL